jgi:hypothetical protein
MLLSWILLVEPAHVRRMPAILEFGTRQKRDPADCNVYAQADKHEPITEGVISV